MGATPTVVSRGPMVPHNMVRYRLRELADLRGALGIASNNTIWDRVFDYAK